MVHIITKTISDFSNFFVHIFEKCSCLYFFINSKKVRTCLKRHIERKYTLKKINTTSNFGFATVICCCSQVSFIFKLCTAHEPTVLVYWFGKVCAVRSIESQVRILVAPAFPFCHPFRPAVKLHGPAQSS